jgi:hypothetical protein
MFGVVVKSFVASRAIVAVIGRRTVERRVSY